MTPAMSTIQSPHKTLVDILDLQKRDVVLITAALGGVGHLAVRLRKASRHHCPL
jgi:NADPH-dependent curcumin reductase CurA